MATKTYDIPGVAVEVKDYQITAAAITTPGDVVILLADLPDTMETVNTSDPMKMKTRPITPNVPMLITSPALSAVISF